MPIRHAGRLANRASTWPRDHFCRSTSAPRSSWPTTWNEFLPISMPMAAILELTGDMACSLSSVPHASFYRRRAWSTAGPSHYRTWRAPLSSAPEAIVPHWRGRGGSDLSVSGHWPQRPLHPFLKLHGNTHKLRYIAGTQSQHDQSSMILDSLGTDAEPCADLLVRE